MVFVLQQCCQECDDKDDVQVPKVDCCQRRSLCDLPAIPAPGEELGDRFGKKMMSNEILIKKSKNLKKIAVAKTPLCLEATNEGINACVKAPSAKMRRNRLGSLKATKNMSLQMDAPSADAIKTSRMSPVTRDMSIPKLLVKIDLSFIKYNSWLLI